MSYAHLLFSYCLIFCINVSPEEDTVRLTQDQIAKLFDKGRTTTKENIKNIFEEKEVDESTSVGISDISSNHRPSKLYNIVRYIENYQIREIHKQH